MKGHNAEMRICLNKFIEFSVDRPHLILASEAIRRYIASGTAVNIQDFKSAQQVLHKHLARCFIAGALFGPTSEEVHTLQDFRDRVLMKNSLGRAFTHVYYKASPPIGAFLLRHPRLSVPVRGALRTAIKLYKISKNS